MLFFACLLSWHVLASQRFGTFSGYGRLQMNAYDGSDYENGEMPWSLKALTGWYYPCAVMLLLPYLETHPKALIAHKNWSIASTPAARNRQRWDC